MLQQGINLTDLTEIGEDLLPPIELDRVALIDGDILMYTIIATVEEIDNLELIYKNYLDYIKMLMYKSNSKDYELHITAPNSCKGGRKGVEVFKKYQDQRQSNELFANLDVVKIYIKDKLGDKVVWHTDQEADDGLTQSQANVRGYETIIVTKDKDLRMVPGLHYDMNTEEILTVDIVGNLEKIKNFNTGKTKITGSGLTFLWYQMLAGDKADNIMGLPFISELNRSIYCPTVKDTKNEDNPVYTNSLTHSSKEVKCGDVTAFNIIQGCNGNILKMYRTVKHLYEDLKNHPAYNYNVEDAFDKHLMLLYMRHRKGQDAYKDIINNIEEGLYDNNT